MHGILLWQVLVYLWVYYYGKYSYIYGYIIVASTRIFMGILLWQVLYIYLRFFKLLLFRPSN